VRQLAEMTALLLTSKLGPGNYHKYRLWQKTIPWFDKRGYWHDQKYYDFLNRVNPYSYRIMARNKVLAKALMRFYKIPDAEYLAYLSGHGGISAAGANMASTADLEALLKQKSSISRLCFKPVEGSGGEGFSAVEVIRGEQLLLRSLRGGATHSVSDFIALELDACRASDYIVEEYLEQHSSLAAFNPSSLNTLRVWVGKSRSGQIQIIGMYLRVGRAGSLVDNRLAGGFCVKVDPDTFTTLVAVPQDGAGDPFTHHPDSNAELLEKKLPFRSEVVSLSEHVMRILPSTQFVGLDVAFTRDRPVIIEFNLAPSPTGACVLGKSHEALLGWIERDESGPSVN